jgi:hypothetical protein
VIKSQRCRDNHDDILTLVLTADDFEQVSKIANPLERCAAVVNIMNASGSIQKKLVSELQIAFADAVKKAFRERLDAYCTLNRIHNT